MTIVKVDSQRRITLPEGNPGDEYEIQKLGEGRFLLIPLKNKPRTREEVIKAMDENPLSPTMSWEELRQMTREP